MFPNIEEQNELEIVNTIERLEVMDKLELTPIKSTNGIKVVGDPYAMFAKGPRDIP